MTTNTAHANCDHEATKAARSKCRRTKGATPHTVTKTMRRVASKPRHVVETCNCGGPNSLGICMLCDRPVAPTMTDLGELLVG